MVTLTTDYGTFESASEKECIALARKAKREHAKAERERAEASDRAYERAAIRGFYLLEQAWRARAGGGRLSRAWIIVDPLYWGGCGVTVRERDSFWGSSRGHVATYEGAEYDHVGYRVVDVIADGCGWVVAIIVRPSEADDDSRDEVYVVGVAGDQVALRLLPMTGAEMRGLISESCV